MPVPAGDLCGPCARRPAPQHQRVCERWQARLNDYSTATVADESDNTVNEGPESEEPVEVAEAEVAPEADPPADPLEEARAEAARLREQLLRTAADFDNFRKRARREQTDAERRARDDLLRDLLPVFDNLERAVQHADAATDVQGLQDGIRMVMRMFQDTLGRMDITRVDSVGQPFDPSVHEAIQQMETPDHPAGTVAAEVQPGYRAGDRLRPAMVVVSKGPPAEASE